MMNHLSDEQLMKHLAQGDKRAAGILYDRYHPKVFGYDLIIDSFKGSLEIRTLSSNVKISNSTGPFTINSISGNLEIDFSSINQESPTSLASVNGLIDMTIPSGEKASFEISSINGNIYNNLDLKNPKENYP